jgi:serine protease Do
MKRSILNLAVLLAAVSSVSYVGSVQAGSRAHDSDQQTVERPRRVQISAGGFLGVELGEVNSEVVQRLKLRDERGALIEGVTSGSGAAQAGLQKDDVIVKWDGESIDSARELSRHIRETPAGRAVRLGVLRGGREIEVNAKMGERTSSLNMVRVPRPTPVARVRVRPAEIAGVRVRDGVRLGAQLQTMTTQLAEYFGLSKRTGALVVFVFADSPAAKAGLKAGDVILSIAGENVENPMDLRRILTTKSEGAVEVKVLRDKQEQTLTVHVEKGTNSWLLQPDDSDEVVAVTTPFTVSIPKIDVRPAVINVPSIKFEPITIQMPRVHIAPIVVPSMNIQVPKVDVEPMKIEIPKIDIAPMRIEVPKIDIAPVKIQILPRRIIV